MNDGAAVDPVDFGEDSLTQLRQGSDADMAKHVAGELGEEFDEIEPGAVFGRVDEREASFGLLGEPSHRLLGFVGGVIVEDELDRGRGRMGGVELFQEFDEFARRVLTKDSPENRGFFGEGVEVVVEVVVDPQRKIDHFDGLGDDLRAAAEPHEKVADVAVVLFDGDS